MNVPRPSTTFFGRSDDLARIERLRGTGVPIVTLWGSPGIGKTRLALELCRGIDAATWFCDLTAARDIAELCAAVLPSLGVQPPAAPATPNLVSAALAGRPAGILVLDNFEHLAHHAEIVGAWAESAPQVFFLVTSRVRLRLQREVTHEVLSLPEAAALFIDRAAPTSALEEESVRELVRRLDGVPLAIELAATRLDVIGVDGLLRRLAQPLDLLNHGPRDGGSAHATLRHAIDGSFRLLTPAAQRALAQCAVFRGGFSLEAAEAVVALEPERPAAVLDVLQELRDSSLLRCLSDGGAVRFAFLESIRAYALEVLASQPDAAEARGRHARYFIGVEKVSAPDIGNLDEAITHALSDESDLLGDVLGALARLDTNVISDALVGLHERAIQLAERRGLAIPLLVSGHHALGRTLQLRGRLHDARAQLERALALADDSTAGKIWTDLGILHHQLRELERARECYESALAIHDRLGNDVAQARCIGNLGAVHHDARRYDLALDHYQRALVRFCAAGERRLEGIFLSNMGILLQERGAFAHARSTHLLALDRLAGVGDRRLEAIAHTSMGMLCHENGELAEARMWHEKALTVFREVIDPRSEALCVGRLAMALAGLGEQDEALHCWRGAERTLARLDDRIATGVIMLFRAFIDLVGGGSETRIRGQLTYANAPALVDLSDDARMALRLIEASLACGGDERGALVVGPKATWFTPPRGTPQQLGDRHVLQRLLLRLVEHHRQAPGEGLTLDALREAGWPDERTLPEAAMNRVHVALTELRRRGLRSCLVRREARYLIDPALRVEISDA